MGGALYKSIKKRGGTLSSVSVFNHKRAPMSHYSHSMPSKQISRQATMHNEATSSFEVKVWWHNNILNSTMSHDHSVACSVCHTGYVRVCKAALQQPSAMYNTKFLSSDMQTPHIRYIRHTKLSLGWMLTWVNYEPIQEIGKKVGGGCSFTRLRYNIKKCNSNTCLKYILYERCTKNPAKI